MADIAGMDMLELALAGLGKVGGEMIFNQVIGNGTLTSGVIKLGSAYILTKSISGKETKAFAMGLAVDGIEDIVIASGILSGIGNLGIGQRNENVI